MYTIKKMLGGVKMDKKYLIVLLFILALPFAIAHEAGEEHSVFEWESLQHIITFVIAVVVAVLGIMAVKKTKKQSTNYIVAGVIAIGLIHFTEFLAESLMLIQLSEDAMHNIEHVLAIVGLLIIGYGFYLMKKE